MRAKVQGAVTARLIAAMWLLGAVISCGSKESFSPSGGSSGGSAGSDAVAQCVKGDTRVCVGPGACNGGQACESDGSWSSCDCGAVPAQGGTANTAGSAGAMSTTAGAGGSSPQAAGGMSGDDGQAGFAGTEAEAGASGMLPGDEPCPTGTLGLDCSGQCGGSPAACDVECGKFVKVDSATVGSTLVRLPSHPGLRCSCEEKGTPSAAFAFGVTVAHVPPGTVHVTLPAPWSFLLYPPASCALPFIAPCGSLVEDGNSMAITTSDPEAPAGNAIVEAGPCP